MKLLKQDAPILARLALTFQKTKRGAYLKATVIPSSCSGKTARRRNLRLSESSTNSDTLHSMSFLLEGFLDDHTLSATFAAARDAFAKAIEWHDSGQFSNVTISEGTVTPFHRIICISDGALGDRKNGHQRCRCDGREAVSAGLPLIRSFHSGGKHQHPPRDKQRVEN